MEIIVVGLIVVAFFVALTRLLSNPNARPTPADPVNSAKRIERAKSSDRTNRSDQVSTAKVETYRGPGNDEFVRSLSVAKVVHVIDGETMVIVGRPVGPDLKIRLSIP